MNLRSRLLAVISALIGVALFIYVIKKTGLSEIASNLRAVGAGFLLVLAVSSTRYLSRSLAWLRCMNPEERRVGCWGLWRAGAGGGEAGGRGCRRSDIRAGGGRADAAHCARRQALAVIGNLVAGG